MTIRLYDVMGDMSYPDAGKRLYDLMVDSPSEEKLIIDLDGVSSLPSMFLNMSIGLFIEEYGVERLRQKVAFANITKQQAERMKLYISRYRSEVYS